MNDTQLSEIRNYLLSKELPIDILLEVQDHFVSQINDLQREENLDFEVAFEKTKNDWKDEFSLETPLYILANRSDKAITKLESRMRREAQSRAIRLSFFISIALFGVLFLSNFLGVVNLILVNKVLLFVVLGFAFIAIFYNLIFNSIAFRKEFQPYKFSVYHWRVFAVFGIGYFMLRYLTPLQDWFFDFLNFNFSVNEVVLKAGIYFFSLMLYIYTGISKIRFAQTISKIKPFIKSVLQ